MGPRRTYKVVGHQRISALNASMSLTVPTVDAQGNAAKPNSVGMLLVAGATPFYYDVDLNKIRLIDATASALSNVLYVEDVGVI